MIRLIIAGIIVLLFLIITLPILFVLWLIGLKNMAIRHRASWAIIKFAFNLLLFVCGTKLTVYGRDNIPEDRSVLLVGNHRSIFDILIMFVNTKRPTGLISKKEMGKYPIFNSWMRGIGCLFLDRDDIKQGLKTILKAIEMVKGGMCMGIFPEGTRCKEEGVFLPFKGGSFKIAEKSECDIIPFTVIGSASIFEDHKPFIKRAKVVVVFGEPVATKGLSRDEIRALPENVRGNIIAMYEEHKNEVFASKEADA